MWPSAISELWRHTSFFTQTDMTINTSTVKIPFVEPTCEINDDDDDPVDNDGHECSHES